MNNNNLSQKLSQNLLEILDNDEEYCDIAIEVGNDNNIRIFRAHMKIDETFMIQIKLPNILPKIFQIILRYIYGGKLFLKDYNNLDIVKLLIAANELNLQELVIYLQSFLIKNKTNWMEQNFNLIYQTSFDNDSFLELQGYCTDLMYQAPHKIFKSLDFTSIPEKILISLIQGYNLQMNEIQIWENVLKWGLTQNPELSSDSSNYSKDDFSSLKNTLRNCIPFIRFYSLTSKEFSDKVLPYKEVLPEDLYMDLLSLHDKLNYKSRPQMSEKTYPSDPTPPIPSTTTYPGYTVTNTNSQKQDTKEVIDPLITRIQPSPKNPNYNPNYNKFGKRNHRQGRRFTSQIEDLDEEKLSSWSIEKPIKNTWKKPVNNTWEEPTNDTYRGNYNGYIPRWNTETMNGNNTKKKKKSQKW
ncbi:unnamed protein product [Rhizophagus irregularis]|nr:unnamed protein product [Rhizophagus irregularis]